MLAWGIGSVQSQEHTVYRADVDGVSSVLKRNACKDAAPASIQPHDTKALSWIKWTQRWNQYCSVMLIGSRRLLER